MSNTNRQIESKHENFDCGNKITRIALYNPFPEMDCAEQELIKRFILAGHTIGVQIEETSSVMHINKLNPDFVLSLHHNTPKLSGIPTYGCMWNPPAFIELVPETISNVLSLDGYLSSGPTISRWIKDLTYASEKEFFITPFYTSCHCTNYSQLDFKDPKLMYCGMNWDGPRFQNLFQILDRKGYMAIYGPKGGWPHIHQSYKGNIPFDGVSILVKLRAAGVGLCLHKIEHIETGVPSMRIFEIVASSAVAICQEHPFIRKVFGDSVLYINNCNNMEDTVKQIDMHLADIKKSPEKMREMTKRAHAIFLKDFTLEKMLQRVVMEHEKLLTRKFTSTIEKDNHLVQIIMRVGGRPVKFIRRALSSIATQTYKKLEVIMIQYKEVEGLELLIEEFKDKFEIKLFFSNDSGFRSTTLWDGFKHLSGKYFAILDDDDIYFPNHLMTLVKILERHPEINLSYSGSVCMVETDADIPINSNTGDRDDARLAYFSPFDASRLWRKDNYITSNAWVAKTNALEPWMLQDPELVVLEDLFLLLCLLTQSLFIFSYETTCCFFWRQSKDDNITFLDSHKWSSEANRIDRLIGDGLFRTNTQRLQENQISILQNQITELQEKLSLKPCIEKTTNRSKYHTHLDNGFVDKNRNIYFSIRWILRHPKNAIRLIFTQPRKILIFVMQHPKLFFTK